MVILLITAFNVWEDIDLQHLSLVCVNLRHLNIKGCISLSDRGISNLLQLCPNLRSFLVCNTSFGNSSVESLCTGSVHSPITSTGDNTAGCAAFKLSSLHIGGCKCKFYVCAKVYFLYFLDDHFYLSYFVDVIVGL